VRSAHYEGQVPGSLEGGANTRCGVSLPTRTNPDRLGERDPLLPRADPEAMAAQIPRVRLTIYDRVGHLPVIKARERVAADLTALCDTLTTR
jgi:pimeloyl-ACP methyl ester carboxylesterase